MAIPKQRADFIAQLENIEGGRFVLVNALMGRRVWVTGKTVLRATLLECAVCGSRGHAHTSWQGRHRSHVRCVCGKATTLLGIHYHLRMREKGGTPCDDRAKWINDFPDASVHVPMREVQLLHTDGSQDDLGSTVRRDTTSGKWVPNAEV